MPDSIEDKLRQVKKKYQDGRNKEATDLIEQIDRRSIVSEENLLSFLIMKGMVFGADLKYVKSIELGKESYELAQKLCFFTINSELGF